MIQIYKAGNENFEMNGDAVLHPSVCKIEEELKGTWKMSLENPPDANVNLIKAGAVIKTDTNIAKNQLFRIYSHDKNDNGVSATAYPIFFDAARETFLTDSRAVNRTGQQALDILFANTRYSGTSDILAANTAYWQKKNCIEALNSDEENSFLSRWGGEPVYDNYHVTVNNRAGGDYGARAEFGYNLAGIAEKVNYENVVTRIVPQAYNGYMLNGSEPWVDSENINKYPVVFTKIIEYNDIKLQADCSGDETGFADLEALRTELIHRAKAEFAAGIDEPAVSYDVTIVDLEQTEEYKDIKTLVKIGLGDTVLCKNRNLNIETKERVVKIVYDCILQRNDEITLGMNDNTYFDNLDSIMRSAATTINPNGTLKAEKITGMMDAAITTLRAQSTRAKNVDIKAVLMEDLNPDSPDFGALALGTKGFMIASARTADETEWDWRTFGTGQGFYADCIIAGILLSKNYNQDTGEGFKFDLDTGDLSANNASLSGTFKNIVDGTGVQIRNRRMEFYASSAIKAIITAISGGGLTFQSFNDGSYTFVISSGDGKNTYPFQITKNGLIGKFKAGVTGTAEFNNGSYLKYNGGICTEVKTSDGTVIKGGS